MVSLSNAKPKRAVCFSLSDYEYLNKISNFSAKCKYHLQGITFSDKGSYEIISSENFISLKIKSKSYRNCNLFTISNNELIIIN